MNFIFLAIFLLLSFISSCSVEAISFDLPALPEGSPSNRRCFVTYVGKGILITGKYNIGEGRHQKVHVEVTDEEGSIHHKNDAANGETPFSFTTHAYSDYAICFTNVLDPGLHPEPQYFRTIQFNMEMGDEMADLKRLESKEKLRPIEAELRILESSIKGIVDEMEYLKERELNMRNTNESTNSRVKWLNILSIAMLLGSGAWQLLYLKRFFQSKKLI